MSPSFDPPGDVLTTDTLEVYTDEGRPMLNNYARHSKVGGGQHGKVYLCYKINTHFAVGHPDRRVPVAMKAVRRDNPRAEQLKRLRQQRLPTSPHVPLADKLNTTEAKIRKEIAIMKKCRHPHVVRLFEVIDDRMRLKIYMIMEYLGGGEVKWRNEQHQPILTVEQTRRIMRDAILGLEYLHHQGIIHRDIKPANLLWTEDRRQVKIGDFGVSHFSYAQRLAAAGKDGTLEDPQDPILLDDSDLTRRAGTPSFLAPEVVFEHTFEPSSSSSGSSPGQIVTSQSLSVANGNRPPITKAIDIWALGVTLYCLLFGRTPFVTDHNNTEWTLYNSICNADWTVDYTMGFDQVPTGGRHPVNENSEGFIVMHLLDHFLEKDMKLRITLEEVKSSVWFLRDLADPKQWLQVTSPTKIHVSTDETSDAMSTVHFRWNWSAQISRRISSLFRIRPQRSRDAIPDAEAGRGPVSSDPHALVHKARASTSRDEGILSSTPLMTKRDKGKRRTDPKTRIVTPSRSKSIDRWPAVRPMSAYTPDTKGRRGSETVLADPLGPSSSQSSPTTTDRPRARFALFLSSISHWRPNKYSSQSSSPTNPTAAPSINFALRQAAKPKSHISKATRRSEEALRFYRSAQNSTVGPLTAERRASSWGQGDQPMEFADVASIRSADHGLNDQDMNVGAGGVCNDRSFVPRTSSRLAAGAISAADNDTHEPRCFDDDSSVASAFDDPQEGWQNGSDLDEDNEDESDDNGVVFSTRRHTEEF